MVHRGRQFEAFSPEGPAEPWQWRAALRTMFPFRRSKMTGWVSGGSSSRRADGQTEPAGGCFDFGASRTVIPGEVSSSNISTRPRPDSDNALRAPSPFPWNIILPKNQASSSSWQVPLLVVRSRCSCMTLPSLSKSWKWPFVHSSKRLLRQATRSLCVAELSGCCRRREGMTIIARKATDSSALLPQIAARGGLFLQQSAFRQPQEGSQKCSSSSGQSRRRCCAEYSARLLHH